MTTHLHDGTEIQIDEQDAHLLSEHRWYIAKAKCGLCYVTYTGKDDGKRKTYLLHRTILGLHGRFPFVDHIDGDGLNNSRSNLRPCTHQQNLRNQVRNPEGKTSRFKGVYWHVSGRKWHARLRSDGKATHLGLFQDENEAASAYNTAARQAFGEFARLNDVFTRDAADRPRPTESAHHPGRHYGGERR